MIRFNTAKYRTDGVSVVDGEGGATVKPNKYLKKIGHDYQMRMRLLYRTSFSLFH